jgi:hypothetical protein
MKKKFEDNVASELPKTSAGEPALPWKIDEADLEKIESASGEFKDLSNGEPPLKARPVFMVMLIVAIFLSAFLMLTTVAVENEGIKSTLSVAEDRAESLKVKVETISVEKAAVESNAVQLEKRVNDLSAQKELFTAVLESLAKKEVDTPESSAQGGSEFNSESIR